jgi:sugar-specific transcriptional regulator TrmB
MNRKELLKNLEEFGFLPHQAQLYLAGITLSSSLMMPLAKKAGVKRTTAIYSMAELLRRGFFKKIKIGKRVGYLPTSPNELIKITEKRKQLILKLLPYLNKETSN